MRFIAFFRSIVAILMLASWVSLPIARAEELPWEAWSIDVATRNARLFYILNRNPIFQNLSPDERAVFEPAFHNHSLEDLYRISFRILKAHHTQNSDAYDLDAAEIGVESIRYRLPGISRQELVETLQAHVNEIPPSEGVTITRLGSATSETSAAESAIRLIGPLLDRWQVVISDGSSCLARCGNFVDRFTELLNAVGVPVRHRSAAPLDHISLELNGVIVDPSIQQLVTHPSIRGILVAHPRDFRAWVDANPDAIWRSLFAHFLRNGNPGAADAWEMLNWPIPDFWTLREGGSGQSPSLFDSFSPGQQHRIQQARTTPNPEALISTICGVLAERRNFLEAAYLAYRFRLPPENIRSYLAEHLRAFPEESANGVRAVSSDANTIHLQRLIELFYPVFSRTITVWRDPHTQSSAELLRRRREQNETLRQMLSTFGIDTGILPLSDGREVIRLQGQNVVIDLHTENTNGAIGSRLILIGASQHVEAVWRSMGGRRGHCNVIDIYRALQAVSPIPRR